MHKENEIHIVKQYSAVKKKEIVKFPGRWMEVENKNHPE